MERHALIKDSQHPPHLPTRADLDQIIAVEDRYKETLRSLFRTLLDDQGLSVDDISQRWDVPGNQVRLWMMWYAIPFSPIEAREPAPSFSGARTRAPRTAKSALVQAKPLIRLTSSVGEVGRCVMSTWDRTGSWFMVCQELNATTQELRAWIHNHAMSVSRISSYYLKQLTVGLSADEELIRHESNLLITVSAFDAIAAGCAMNACDERRLLLDAYRPGHIAEIAEQIGISPALYLKLVRFYNSGQLPKGISDATDQDDPITAS